MYFQKEKNFVIAREQNETIKIEAWGSISSQTLISRAVLELAQRNSQISIPFYLSSLGYGFLWNNPGIQ